MTSLIQIYIQFEFGFINYYCQSQAKLKLKAKLGWLHNQLEAAATVFGAQTYQCPDLWDHR